MPVNPNLAKVEIAYTADDGVQYALVTSHNHAAAIPNTSGAGLPAFPKKWKPRVVHGKQISATGRDKKMSIVVPSKTGGIWSPGISTFDVAPYGTFTVTGFTGERRSQAAPDYNGTATPPNERVAIAYTGDDGNTYRIVTSRAHAAAVGATAAGAAPGYPKRWTPRHYGLLNPDLTGADQRITLVEPNPAAAAWVADTSFTFTVAGVAFNTTGRMDEDRPHGAAGYVP